MTTDQNENHFFFPSEFNDTGKGMNTKLKVFPASYELREKAEGLYKTHFKSLFVNYQGDSQCQVKNYEKKNIHLMHSNIRLTTLAVFLIRLQVLAKKIANWLAHNLGLLSARKKMVMSCTWEQSWTI